MKGTSALAVNSERVSGRLYNLPEVGHLSGSTAKRGKPLNERSAHTLSE
jgi:hypothetical protein